MINKVTLDKGKVEKFRFCPKSGNFFQDDRFDQNGQAQVEISLNVQGRLAKFIWMQIFNEKKKRSGTQPWTRKIQGGSKISPHFKEGSI